MEMREAFDFENIAEVQKFIAPLIDSGEISLVDVGRGENCFVELTGKQE